jgi:hypothetical protein
MKYTALSVRTRYNILQTEFTWPIANGSNLYSFFSAQFLSCEKQLSGSGEGFAGLCNAVFSFADGFAVLGAESLAFPAEAARVRLWRLQATPDIRLSCNSWAIAAWAEARAE